MRVPYLILCISLLPQPPPPSPSLIMFFVRQLEIVKNWHCKIVAVNVIISVTIIIFIWNCLHCTQNIKLKNNYKLLMGVGGGGVGGGT